MEQDILDKPFLPLDRLRILKYFSLYSATVAIALLALFLNGVDLDFLGVVDPKLYPIIVTLYAAMTVVFMVLAFSTGQASYDHLIAFFLIDITLHSGLIYCSGSGTSLSYLMILTIAVGNSLVSGQKGLLLSAWGAISLIFVEHQFDVKGLPYDYMKPGTLGVIFFLTALVIHALVKRLQLSVDINAVQADNLLSMEQLTKLVLKRLETGVLVLNNQNEIIFQNIAAQRLLGFPEPIRAVPEKLKKELDLFRKFPKYHPHTLKAGPTTPKVQPMFAPLMPGSDRGTVIFLEDTNIVYQQAQRLKQASLGKLAASIVREIKIPMQGIHKIAHEVSLASVSTGDKQRQLQIKQYSQQIEHIISNVQNMGNAKATEFAKTSLSNWATETVKALQPSILRGINVEMNISKNAQDAYFDPSQLRQVLSNLLENAAYFARMKNSENPDNARVQIVVTRTKVSQQGIIEVRDNGYGVGLDDLDHIYEPFYSSEQNKSGLGLYIARQFCDMNMARLDYIAAQEGAVFRITFPTNEQIERMLATREDFVLRDATKDAMSA
ncbi:MAG: hypothetical protein H7A10_07775 [Oceanospirillaceae bacterium]|nr:hypothetical protein [Oceanospirillaceae bacterium]